MFQGTFDLMKNDDEQTLETLRSFQDDLKRKIKAARFLEDEVISIIDNPAGIEQILEGMAFEIHSKAKLNFIQKYLNTKWQQLDLNPQALSS